MSRSLALAVGLLVSLVGCHRETEPPVEVAAPTIADTNADPGETAPTPAEGAPAVKLGQAESGAAAEMKALMAKAGSAEGAMEAARSEAEAASCMSNLKQLCLAALMYSSDRNGVHPGKDWADSTQPYLKDPKVLVCPSAPDRPVGYALNSTIAGANEKDVARPGDTVLFFEADVTKDKATGSLKDCVFRHSGMAHIGFADGHVKLVGKDHVGELVWDVSKKAK